VTKERGTVQPRHKEPKGDRRNFSQKTHPISKAYSTRRLAYLLSKGGLGDNETRRKRLKTSDGEREAARQDRGGGGDLIYVHVKSPALIDGEAH